MKTLIITDNLRALDLARELQEKFKEQYQIIDIYQSPESALSEIKKIDLKQQMPDLGHDYDFIMSLHCRQLFPSDLIDAVRCVNVHPGYNPYNRGWYPHVFSIINGLKAGVTIHEIDNKIDHGAIIIQKECKIESWDTSGTVYDKIISMERQLLLENFALIRERSYKSVLPHGEGNINYKKDYEMLKKIDLDEKGTFGDFLNRVRALTHGDYRNAYFIDESGRKVFVRIELEPEDKDHDP